MNKNILIVLGGAILVAVLVAALVQISLGGKKTDSKEPTTEILVASSDLSIGRELKEGDTRWQVWPESNLFPGAIIRDKEKDEKPEDALKGRLARDIAKGEPVMKSALLGQVKGNMVAASLEPGMRAVALEVSASSMVGGFIGPGDYVDVIMTYKASVDAQTKDPRVKEMIELNLDKMASETILQNIKILAIDQTAKRPDEEKVKVGKTVTLAVSVKDAEKLSLAAQMGELTLALRGVGDNAQVSKEWPTVSDMRMTNITKDIFEEYRKLKKGTGNGGNSVRIYNGDQVTVAPAQ